MNWISVKDRLPKESEHVIGYCRTNINPEWHVEPLLFDIYDKKELWAYLFAYKGYDYAIEISHWMPLPEPPKDLC